MLTEADFRIVLKHADMAAAPECAAFKQGKWYGLSPQLADFIVRGMFALYEQDRKDMRAEIILELALEAAARKVRKP